jgi:transposase-like protein
MLKGRHFDRSVILRCVRRYLAHNLSLRDLEEIMAERGLSVDHSAEVLLSTAVETCCGTATLARHELRP